MKVYDLHRKQQLETVKLIQQDRDADTQSAAEIAAQVDQVRNSFVASRQDFAARAAKARKSFPKTPNTVLLG